MPAAKRRPAVELDWFGFPVKRARQVEEEAKEPVTAEDIALAVGDLTEADAKKRLVGFLKKQPAAAHKLVEARRNRIAKQNAPKQPRGSTAKVPKSFEALADTMLKSINLPCHDKKGKWGQHSAACDMTIRYEKMMTTMQEGLRSNDFAETRLSVVNTICTMVNDMLECEHFMIARTLLNEGPGSDMATTLKMAITMIEQKPDELAVFVRDGHAARVRKMARAWRAQSQEHFDEIRAYIDQWRAPAPGTTPAAPWPAGSGSTAARTAPWAA